MLSFQKLGKMGRLGNQLFQYAFLRTQSEELGVKFYCPHWIGDDIFELNDHHLKIRKPKVMKHAFIESIGKNYDRKKLILPDNTEIEGNFESEDNFNIYKLRGYYVFKQKKIARVKGKYKHIDFSKSVGIHLRLGDKLLDRLFKRIYFIPRMSYYIKSINMIGQYKSLLVFSDSIDLAKEYFKDIDKDFIFIEDNSDWEDLFLMSQCRNLICGVSTLSWWGGWLNSYQDKKIIYPKEGTFRPFGFFRNKDFIPKNGITVRALRPIIDSFLIAGFPFYGLNIRMVCGYGFRAGRSLKKIISN